MIFKRQNYEIILILDAIPDICRPFPASHRSLCQQIQSIPYPHDYPHLQWLGEHPSGPQSGKRFGLPEGLKRMDDFKECKERYIKNVIIGNDKDPKDKKSALDTIPEGGKLCHNNDQNVEIRVTRKAARHGFRRVKESEYASIGEIERIIGEAVKISVLLVDESEKGKTDSVSVYYCPVNVDGTQHSARMVVKQYFDMEGVVLEVCPV